MKHNTNSLTFKEIPVDGYERVVEITDEKSGLHAFIAIHNTKLGPALGGIRAYPYKSVEEAKTDVLRLAKGMTYKSGVSQVGTGGGKSVIIINNQNPKPEKVLLAFAEAVNAFEGQYICAEDVGMRGEDLNVIRQKTPYIVGIRHPKSSGDPSPYTTWGGYRGIQAVCKKLFGSNEVKGKKIAIQGLGSVGMKLARQLFWEGAQLFVTDVDKDRNAFAAKEFGATVVSPSEIYEVECDIFAPCALGGIINSSTIPRFKCKAIAGLANNQLLTDEDGDALYERGILYAPDYVINSGGLITVCVELEEKGYDCMIARDRVSRIYDFLTDIFALSDKRKQSPHRIAEEIAEKNLKQGIGKRVNPVTFHH